MIWSEYDFHFHSLYSDGSLSLDEIFQSASRRGLKALALADHDTVLGLPEENEVSKKYGIPYVPAAEFTAQEEGLKFHVLGYGIDAANPALIEYSHQLLETMNQRSLRQIEKMQRDGINIPTEEFFRQAAGGPLYRAKLLGVLASYGYLKREEIMSLLPAYFGKEAPYYEKDLFPYRSMQEIADMIHNAGGVVVLAHPGRIKDKNPELYDRLVQSPLLDGLEVYHPRNTPEVRQQLLDIAAARGLIYTGGSDCHGDYMKQPLSVGGELVPPQCAEFLTRFMRNL